MAKLFEKISYYYYYLYFNAYWASFDVGEKSIPRQNAIYYMCIVKIFIFVGILFGVASRHQYLPYFLIVGSGLIALLNHFLLTEDIFKAKFDAYSFLQHTSKRSRLTVFFGLVVLAAMLQLAGVYRWASQ